MKDQFVPFETSKLFKERGFDEECFGYYNKEGKIRYAGTIDERYRTGGMETDEMKNSSLNSLYCSAPLWQQCFNWLKEKHDIVISIDRGGSWKQFNVFISKQGNSSFIYNTTGNTNKARNFDSYEEALEEGLIQSLLLI